jgi:erythromycin esterase
MHTFAIARRRLLASIGASAALALPQLKSPVWAQTPDPLQDWLGTHAIPVRGVDPLDEDFSDLEPLRSRIAGARVVQLGEPSHGAGTCFAAKVRLVKFLHARMGFDVLAWESGLYDLTRTEADLSAGADAVAAAQRGILKIWSASEQCRPLFEYAKASHGAKHPLIMAGFDMQLNSDAFVDLAPELRSFVGAAHRRSVREAASRAANEVLEAFAGFDAYLQALVAHAASLPPLPGKDVLERLRRAAIQLDDIFQRHAHAFGEERQRGFLARTVANLAGFAANLYESNGSDGESAAAELVRENRRDAINAQNLHWLIEKGYPGRKIIVWAHNAHVMNAYYKSDWKSISLEPVADAMKPSGVYLAEWLGRDLYTIGCTAYAGEEGWPGGKPTPIAASREGSIEERLHRLGLPYALLDLRAARAMANHPLRKPQTMRIPKYDEIEIADATRAYDAIFYVARMEPATLLRRRTT